MREAVSSGLSGPLVVPAFLRCATACNRINGGNSSYTAHVAPTGIDMRSLIQSTVAHMLWADARILGLLTSAEPSTPLGEPLRLFSHLIAAERVWLLRLRRQGGAAPPVWPKWSPTQLKAVAQENARDYRQLIDNLADADLEREIEYANSQGVTFRTSTADILTQVLLHGSYHRGQIAMALRAGGVVPVNTDYITFVRERGRRRASD